MYLTNSSLSLPSEAEVSNASGFNQVLNNLFPPTLYLFQGNIGDKLLLLFKKSNLEKSNVNIS